MTAIFVTADRIVALVDCPDIDASPPAEYVMRPLRVPKPMTLAGRLEIRRYYRTHETVDGLPVYKEG